MSGEQAKTYIKNDIENYLRGKGINPGKNFICLNPEHPEKNPSMSFDKRRNRVHCFSCGANYDTFDLIGIEYGLDKKEAFKKAMELYGVESDRPQTYQNARATKPPIKKETKKTAVKEEKPDIFDYAAYFQKAQAALSQTDYLEKRGISHETAERFGIGFDPEFRTNTGTWQALIIPTGEKSFTARNTDETASKENRIRKRGPSAPYRLPDVLKLDKPIFIVEGEIDALSVAEAGAEAFALGSVANLGQVLGFFEEWVTSGALPPNPQSRDTSLDNPNVGNDPVDRSREGFPKGDIPLAGFGAEPQINIIDRTLLIALDNDKEGEKAAAKLLEGFKELGLKAYQVQIAEGYKDPNEALMADREGFLRAVREAEKIEERQAEAERKRYQKNSAAYYIQDFLDGIANSADTPATPTGFSNLDEALDGGLYEGLYIFGAISSLGKTTLLVQMADQIAETGRDVLFFSLEMARAELMAKSISRMTLQACLEEKININNAKTTRGITVGKRYAKYSDKEHALINACVKQYGEYADRIYIHEGIGDIGVNKIRETVGKHVAVTGNFPVIMIDYLQILAPYNERMTDKQNTDKAVLELKRISRDFKIPVIGVSSFNRQNYREEVTMEAFKESGAIEYSSDVLIGLQLQGAGTKEFDVNEAKRKNPRDVELKVLKNRNGRTGVSLSYEYYPLFNYFREG